MDGSWLTALSGLVEMPLLILITGGIGYGLVTHIRDCSGNRKDIYSRMEALRKEMHQDSETTRKGVNEVKESVARIEGMLNK